MILRSDCRRQHVEELIQSPDGDTQIWRQKAARRGAYIQSPDGDTQIWRQKAARRGAYTVARWRYSDLTAECSTSRSVYCRQMTILRSDGRMQHVGELILSPDVHNDAWNILNVQTFWPDPLNCQCGHSIYADRTESLWYMNIIKYSLIFHTYCSNTKCRSVAWY